MVVGPIYAKFLVVCSMDEYYIVAYCMVVGPMDAYCMVVGLLWMHILWLKLWMHIEWL